MQKIHEAADSSGLNPEQRRDDLPFLGAVVTRQRAHALRVDDVRRQLEPMRPREQQRKRATVEIDKQGVPQRTNVGRQGERPILPSGKSRVLRTTPGTGITTSKTQRIRTVTTTAKRRRREARLDKCFGARMCEKSPLGLKTRFSVTRRRKSDAGALSLELAVKRSFADCESGTAWI